LWVCPLLLLIAFGALSWIANRSVYLPSRYPEGFWQAQAELGAEDVWIDSEPGVRLHSWFLRTPDSRLVALYLHGNAGNISHRLQHARELAAAGLSLLLVDYRGYGRSSGSPSESGLYRDAQAAYDRLLKLGFKPEQIVVYGESLGTAVAVELASRNRCGAVILEAAFSSAGAVARGIVPVIGPLLVRSFNSRSRIGRVRAPILFLHGDHDEVIPLALAQELYKAAPEPKKFWMLPGAGHNDLVECAGPDYRQRLQSFLSALAG
jgi:fermentation-respiration switch protein FrsA (DUF1100 family)